MSLATASKLAKNSHNDSYINEDHHSGKKKEELYFRLSENGPELLRQVLLERGWREYDEDADPYWNLWWKGSRYTAKEYKECKDWQRLNHFPKSALITRKVSLLLSIPQTKPTFS